MIVSPVRSGSGAEDPQAELAGRTLEEAIDVSLAAARSAGGDPHLANYTYSRNLQSRMRLKDDVLWSSS